MLTTKQSLAARAAPSSGPENKWHQTYQIARTILPGTAATLGVIIIIVLFQFRFWPTLFFSLLYVLALHLYRLFKKHQTLKAKALLADTLTTTAIIAFFYGLINYTGIIGIIGSTGLIVGLVLWRLWRKKKQYWQVVETCTDMIFGPAKRRGTK